MMRIAQRALIAGLALAAFAVSLLSYVDERRARVPVDEAITEYLLDARRPAEVRTLRYQPAVDLRMSSFAIMTLDDLYRPVSLAKLSAAERGQWLQSLVTLDAQLARARDFALDALARRPGWAYHHALLGQVEYSALRRDSYARMVEERRRWEIPMRNAIAAAPGDSWLAAYLAHGFINVWGAVEAPDDFEEILARALTRPDFVNQYYRIVGQLVGSDRAIALLPDDVALLRIAFARERKDSRIAEAARLRTRIDAAEREARAKGLASIRERARLRDVWAQRSQATQWVARHRPEEIDDEAGRAQVAEILSLWPRTKRGPWLRDPRGDLVRYFLSGRESAVNGDVLVDAIDLLGDVPEPVHARVLALAGRTWEADQMVRASATVGSFEWTPVLVDLARAQFEAGRRDEAGKLLAMLSPSARGECNVLLLRRELDDPAAAEQLSRVADVAAASGERLSLCIDPARHGDASLRLTLGSSAASLVSWGWDGGRVGSIVVDGERELVVPLSGMRGRHPLHVETEVGPRATIARVVIEGMAER